MNRVIRAVEALGVRLPKNIRAKLAKLTAVLLALSGVFIPAMANATTLGHASVALSDPRPSATSVNYTFTVGDVGSPVTSSAIKCVKIVYATTATDTSGTTAPTSFSDASVTTASLASSTLVNSSATGWSVAVSGAGNNVIKYTNSTGVTPSTTTGATFVDNLVTNSSVADTAYYAFFNTYSDTGCTTPIDNATVEFINTNGSLLSLTIDDTLTFTVNGIGTGGTCSDGSTHPNTASTATTIPFGTVVSGSTYEVCQDLQAASNSTNGYTIYLRYDHAPTNALSQTITDWSGSNTTPTGPFATVNSQGAYGYSTDDNTLGTGTPGRFTSGTKYAAATTSNAEVGYEAAGVSTTHYDITHAIAITNTTQPGTYTNTIIYTCTPVY